MNYLYQSEDIAYFIKEFSQELLEGTGAYFIGAGISKPSNLPEWAELLEPFANKIGIKDLKGKDLPSIAQYVINEEIGNRGPFINGISRKLRKRYSPNVYHEWITQTNVKTIWTTNYDNLLEVAFADHIIDLKVNDDSISRNVPDAQVEIIKMHGCIFNSHREEIVVTESDYEDFFIKKPATAQRLKIDLLQKSFLFIGYGYGDPNIKNIIAEARRISNNATRQHYFISIKKADKQSELWRNNLRKYGIRVIEIDGYIDLVNILQELSLKSRGKSVFITGSHKEKDNVDSKLLGKELALDKDVILIDGQSSGIMRSATSAFMETVIGRQSDINKRLRFFPNPYAANSNFSNDFSLLPLLRQWRLSLFKSVQIVVAFDGGMGTMAEIEKALELGCTVIPYFNSKSEFLAKFLFDEKITKRINELNKDYLTKAKEDRLNIEDVINLIKAALLR